jgi:UDP-N-acetylglucosamine 2-epimerase (non-hydrolysing)
LEAGLRTYDISKPYPEEAYRQMISRLTDIHLCPHEANAILLRNEHVNGHVHVVGNTILDLVKSYNLTVQKGNTVLITFHRRENLKYLTVFMEKVNELIHDYPDKHFIWALHPNKDLQSLIQQTIIKCTFIQPCSHFEFLQYVKDCYCVLTDSGGIQEECAFLGKPTIVLRHFTERDQLQEPYLYIVQPPYSGLKNTFNSIPQEDLKPCFVYGTGNSSYQITQILDEEQCA